MIAEKIREITDPESGLYIWDKEQRTYRLTEYRDIAILLRTVSGWAEELISVLLSKGISASADTGSGYFSALEVQTILNLLEIIDNPLQDIPLAAVMHSPIGHFSSEELAIIRAEEPPSQCKHLYDAATSFAQKYAILEISLIQGLVEIFSGDNKGQLHLVAGNLFKIGAHRNLFPPALSSGQLTRSCVLESIRTGCILPHLPGLFKTSVRIFSIN